jgi:hypothetical protein
VNHFRNFARRAFMFAACLAMMALASAPSHAAAKIQHLVSPGGIEAWFVQDATVPLIAMEYAFAGGAAQDPADKSGVGNMVANLLDEGSEDLDSKTFHERLDRRAIELSFSSTRDYFRGSLRMLKDNRDEAFDLLRKALTSPHFETADNEARSRPGPLGPAPRQLQSLVAGRPQVPGSRLLATIPMAGSRQGHWKACHGSIQQT